MKKQLKNAKGITLIALVITIIVFLILAGLSIAMLTGDNGIITQANNTKVLNEKATAKEKVQVEVGGSRGTDGKLDYCLLEKNLNNIKDIEGVPSPIKAEDFPIEVTVDKKYNYIINSDGSVDELIEREGIEIGDYVDYIPDLNEAGYEVDKLAENITGSNSNNSIISQENLKWRILKIYKNGTVDLISESKTNQRVYFSGAVGYNNGVYVLNEICKQLYSNSNLEVTARSINIEDIEAQMNSRGETARSEYTSAVKYGESKTFESENNQYPNLYAQENGSGINSTTIKTNGINKSDIGDSIPMEDTSNTANNGLTVTQTYYNFPNSMECFDNNTIYDMLFNKGNYWIASRYSYCLDSYAGFGLRNLGNSNLSGGGMFISNGNSYTANYCFRPIASLKKNIQIIPVENADGSDSNHMHKLVNN